jgi:dTDP-4-dehydrorhamnose 3,5-epimerase
MVLINHKTFLDNRGSYTPIPLNTLEKTWDQCSISVNDKKFTFRGMHYQTNPPQEKYVKVIRGSIMDFTIDLTTNKLEYIKVGVNDAVYIPSDKSHGFLTLEPDTIVTYLVNGEYNPYTEHSIVWSSHEELKSTIEDLIGEHELVISDKDKLGK